MPAEHTEALQDIRDAYAGLLRTGQVLEMTGVELPLDTEAEQEFREYLDLLKAAPANDLSDRIAPVIAVGERIMGATRGDEPWPEFRRAMADLYMQLESAFNG